MGMLTFLAANGLGMSESFFTATNATPGTGIETINDTPTTVTATTPQTIIYNQANATSGENQWVIPMYYRLSGTAVNTSGTNFRIAQYLDNIDRYTSGGTAITGKSTSYDTRTGYTDRTPKARVNHGVLVATAAGSQKLIANTYLSDDVFVVDETVELVYGDQIGGGVKDTSSSMMVAPVWIGRKCSLLYHWLTTGTDSADLAAEIEICWAELKHTRF